MQELQRHDIKISKRSAGELTLVVIEEAQEERVVRELYDRSFEDFPQLRRSVTAPEKHVPMQELGIHRQSFLVLSGSRCARTVQAKQVSFEDVDRGGQVPRQVFEEGERVREVVPVPDDRLSRFWLERGFELLGVMLAGTQNSRAAWSDVRFRRGDRS